VGKTNVGLKTEPLPGGEKNKESNGTIKGVSYIDKGGK
jgi:hypothetical protein